MVITSQKQTETKIEVANRAINLKIILQWVWPSLALVTILFLFATSLVQGSVSYSAGTGLPNIEPNVEGVFGEEKNEQFAYRWTRPEWKISLLVAPIRPYELRLTALSLQSRSVEVRDDNDNLLFTFTPDNNLQNYRFDIPASAISSKGMILKFKTPSYLPGDGRRLGILLTEIELNSKNGFGLPGQTLIYISIGLGIGLSWLFTEIVVAIRGWRKRPLWPYAIGLVSGAFACWFTVNAQSDALRLLPMPITYIWDAVGIIFLSLGLAWLLNFASKYLTFLQFRPTEHEINVLPKPRETTPKKYLYILAAIVLIGFAGRLANPLVLPIFVDETFHTKAGAYVVDGTNSLFFLASEGRILYSWVLSAVYLFTGLDNLLLWGRWLSAFTGLVTILVCYKIGERLFSARGGLIAAGLWAIIPYSFWHERMSLVDPMSATFIGITIYFTLRLLEVSKPRQVLLFGILTGLALSAALLTKLLSLLMLPISGLLLIFIYSPRRWANYLPRIGITYATYWLSTIFFVSQYQGDWDSSHRFSYVGSPTFNDMLNSVSEFVQWFYAYVTPPLLLVCLIGIGWLFTQRWRIATPLVLSTLFAIVPLFLFSRLFFPRYMLYIMLPLIVVAAGGLDLIFNKLRQHRMIKWGYIGLAIVLLPALWFDYLAVTAPVEAALPQLDKVQYQIGMSSGKGASEASDFLLKEQAVRQQPLAVLEYSWVSDYLSVLMYGHSEFIHINFNNIDSSKVQKQLLASDKTNLFLIYVSSKLDPTQDFLALYPNIKFKQVLAIARPIDTMYIYEVTRPLP